MGCKGPNQGKAKGTVRNVLTALSQVRQLSDNHCVCLLCPGKGEYEKHFDTKLP
jgi:hypothetical protein